VVGSQRARYKGEQRASCGRLRRGLVGESLAVGEEHAFGASLQRFLLSPPSHASLAAGTLACGPGPPTFSGPVRTPCDARAPRSIQTHLFAGSGRKTNRLA
jgi:hypothetical protein